MQVGAGNAIGTFNSGVILGTGTLVLNHSDNVVYPSQINDAGLGLPDVDHADDRRQHCRARQQAHQPHRPSIAARRREPHRHDGEP